MDNATYDNVLNTVWTNLENNVWDNNTNNIVDQDVLENYELGKGLLFSTQFVVVITFFIVLFEFFEN